ncbi:hypothetical protein F5Y02DRAFT_411638 [Annulohypoxylon stygium]|nr:hypothetical protein F5Y02DRAFT_411638 [Annulohypoxylon stygium]
MENSEPEKVPTLMTTGLVVVSVVFPALSLICVILRFRARYVTCAPLLEDEWWILASWMFSLFLSIDVWIVGGITGIDYYKINLAEGLKDSVIVRLLLFYKRIFPTPRFKIAVWIGIVITACWGITLFFAIQFTGTARWVLDTTQLGLAQAWTSIVLDVAILCYPLPIIFSSHMETSRKIVIALIFWLGLFCCVAAAVRLVLVKQNIEKVSKSAGLQIHSKYVEIMFVIIEPNCSIIAAFLPCYGYLLNNGATIDSMVRSARSIFSLGSIPSTSRVFSRSLQTGWPAGQVAESQVEPIKHKGGWPKVHDP